MPSERSTLLTRLERVRAECIQLAAETNEFLNANGRTAVSVVKADKLRFAVLGQYNVGKSTLVNAFLGQRVAETGDAPTTRLAHEYPFRDFCIFDLPGSDAHIAEQNEARSALEEVHVVLYVISSQNLDIQTIWDDLRLLSNRSEPFLVVINDKQPHQDAISEKDHKETQLEHFFRRAKNELRSENWGDRLFWVEAKSAEKGRLEGKSALEKDSGIIPLEGAVVDLLIGSDEFLRSVPRLGDLRLALQAIERECAAKLSSDESQALQKALERCEIARDKLDAAAETIANDHFPALEEDLANKFCRSEKGIGSSQAVAEVTTLLCQDTFSATLDAFEKKCQAEIKFLGAYLLGNRTIQEKNIARNDPRLQLGDIADTASGCGPDVSGILGKVVQLAPSLMEATQQLTAQTVQGGIEQVAVETAKKGTQQVVKSAGQSLARQAGVQVTESTGRTAGRLLGGVVIVAVAAWEIYAGFRKAAEEKRKMEANLQEMQHVAHRAATMLRHQFLGTANHHVGEILGPLTQSLQQELRARGPNVSDLESRVARAAQLRGRLETVINELNARVPE